MNNGGELSSTGNKKGLGRGLGALISLFDEDIEEMDKGTVVKSTVNTNEKHATVDGGVLQIDVNLIDNNASQPRKAFDPDEMHELEQSILASGVLQPILVNRVGARYMIVAGERRWRASKSVGLKTIPAIVRDYSSRQIAEIALVENLLRSDLNEIEVANGIRKLMDTHLMTQEQVSRVLGRSRSSIANTLRLLALPKEVQVLIEAKKISAGHAKCLVSIGDRDKLIALANRCAQGLSVRELEFVVSGGKSEGIGKQREKAPRSLELKQLELNLVHLFATKVQIVGNDNSGKIVIEYHSKQQIERIMSHLK
jgi:ParB family chromosome partitioning protein